MDFALERIRTLKPDQLSKEFLLEIAWLYDRIVKTGSKVPVVDLAFELVWPIDFVGECVRNAIDLGLIHSPKKGSNGGLITKKALKMLGQVER